MSYGTLYLIPVPLADEVADASFTPGTIALINRIDEYIVENEKTARKFLKQAGMQRPQNELTLHDYGKHQRANQPTTTFFSSLMTGKDVGLMSEAGCPGVADPGSEIVAEAHKRGIKVVPLVGPSSILLALMASGFDGQNFAFHGYLPIDKGQKTHKLRELEKESSLHKKTQIFIETPFRNHQLLEELVKTLRPQTELCVAIGLTGPNEKILKMSIADWRKANLDFHKIPAIFLIQSS